MIYNSIDEVFLKAQKLVGKTLREILEDAGQFELINSLDSNRVKTKGKIGGYIENYFFEIFPGSSSKPDIASLWG